MELDKKSNRLMGYFMSDPPVVYDASDRDKEIASSKGELFRSYIWGDQSIDNLLMEVVNAEYGKDLELILFQFILNPFPFQLPLLPDIEKYRKIEKAIGVNIIITDANFFSLEHSDRVLFIKRSLLERVKMLEIKYKKKLDTRFDLLERELKKLLFADEKSCLV